MTMSFPGQSHAANITVFADRLVKEDVVQPVQKTGGGWQVRFGETKDGAPTSLILNAGKPVVSFSRSAIRPHFL